MPPFLTLSIGTLTLFLSALHIYLLTIWKVTQSYSDLYCFLTHLNTFLHIHTTLLLYKVVPTRELAHLGLGQLTAKCQSPPRGEQPSHE